MSVNIDLVSDNEDGVVVARIEGRLSFEQVADCLHQMAAAYTFNKYSVAFNEVTVTTTIIVTKVYQAGYVERYASSIEALPNHIEDACSDDEFTMAYQMCTGLRGLDLANQMFIAWFEQYETRRDRFPEAFAFVVADMIDLDHGLR
jgi:hypothetical protein